jgi:hypothetical protein
MSFTKDFARGCLIDFLVGVAAMILLGCWYWGFSGGCWPNCYSLGRREDAGFTMTGM